MARNASSSSPLVSSSKSPVVPPSKRTSFLHLLHSKSPEGTLLEQDLVSVSIPPSLSTKRESNPLPPRSADSSKSASAHAIPQSSSPLSASPSPIPEMALLARSSTASSSAPSKDHRQVTPKEPPSPASSYGFLTDIRRGPGHKTEPSNSVRASARLSEASAFNVKVEWLLSLFQQSRGDTIESKGKCEEAASPKKAAKVKPRASQQPSMAADPHWQQTAAILKSSIPFFDISPVPDANFRVSRKFLNHRYDINTGSFLAIMKAECNPSDRARRRSMLFPLIGANPDLPIEPGSPGLILTAREDILQIQPVSIFIKPSEKITPSLWLYAGGYKLKKAGQLTGEQFAQLPQKTQQGWAKCLDTMKRDVWSLMRARIYLRLHNIPLTEKNIADEHGKIKKQNKKDPRTLKAGQLDIQDYIDAFVKGEERLDIVEMQCVEYDHVFVQHMKDEHKIWSKTHAKAPELNKSRGRGTKVKAKSEAKLESEPDEAVISDSDSLPRARGRRTRSNQKESSQINSNLRRSSRNRMSLGSVTVALESKSEGGSDTEGSDGSEYRASE
ncbi:hypothetical protein D9757_009411 [Collybiopsis confluens]|uniref:DUF6697 domain-containing protein n=1 Tax=Collybiopsis confluens TaxID=2823264 RepID=A0A8H5HD92_9AGAR|nr:hypothetical protein D9757_009411 [Collybiopsis confluens]